MKFKITDGYLGQCFCGKDAITKVWTEFSEPIPANPALNLPEVTGCFTFVCEEHAS